MKKIFVFLIGLFLFAGSKAQQSSFSITPMQAGTINLNQGKGMVKLSGEVQNLMKDQSLNASYYVIFTPSENTITTSISNKTINSFAVSAQSSKSVAASSVDYILFVKRKVVQLSVLKSESKIPVRN